MKRPRLEMALERLGSGDWERFEHFASAFMATEYETLRTVAAPSGDEGRDAELFSPVDDVAVVLQFSVAKNWEAKIKSTIKRLKGTLPNVSVLIYVTNQGIGADGDTLKSTIRKNDAVFLDICDKSYFLERFLSDSKKELVSEELAKDIVDPILSSSGIIERQATELTGIESKAAFVHLGLQWKDDERDKGLTKLSFEALVRSILRDTSAEKRLTRTEIREQVRVLLKNHSPDMVDVYTDSALHRLTKKAIRYYQKEDEFCLSHQEKVKFKEYLIELELADVQLVEEIEKVSSEILISRKIDYIDCKQFSTRIRRVLERFLSERSEAFASAFQAGSIKNLTIDDVINVSISDISKFSDTKKANSVLPELLPTAVRNILLSSSLIIQGYLRRLADSYTLLSFLKVTPDIQSAVEKMFSHGEIWLDTAVILPLLAEEVLEPEERRFQKMIKTALDAGLQFRVIPGVIEEVERHMNKCIAYIRAPAGVWRGYIPYLLAQYLETGKSLGGFSSWLESFRGNLTPEDDIAEYLLLTWGIEKKSLESDALAAPENLRHALKEFFIESHKKRRKSGHYEIDEISIQRLAAHDAESYAGIINKRTEEKTSPFGYSAWWLTLDRTAFEVEDALKKQYDCKIKGTPVLSADFLVNYLAFGPVRKRVSKATESGLPVLVDAGLVRYMTPELIEEAEKIREEMSNLSDIAIRRRIRDTLYLAKCRYGTIAKGGVQVVRRQQTPKS